MQKINVPLATEARQCRKWLANDSQNEDVKTVVPKHWSHESIRSGCRISWHMMVRKRWVTLRKHSQTGKWNHSPNCQELRTLHWARKNHQKTLVDKVVPKAIYFMIFFGFRDWLYEKKGNSFFFNRNYNYGHDWMKWQSIVFCNFCVVFSIWQSALVPVLSLRFMIVFDVCAWPIQSVSFISSMYMSPFYWTSALFLDGSNSSRHTGCELQERVRREIVKAVTYKRPKPSKRRRRRCSFDNIPYKRERVLYGI